MIIPYDIWLMDFMNEYHEKIERKHGHNPKRFGFFLEKLWEWEDEHLRKYGYNYYEGEEEY